MTDSQPKLRVTEIGEYIAYRSCERRFKLGLNGRQLARSVPFASRLFNTIDLVLEDTGHQRENEWEAYLVKEGLQDLTNHGTNPQAQPGTPWAEFVGAAASVPIGQAAFGREVSVDAQLGEFHISGQIDFAIIRWEGGKLKLRIVECKASRRDRTAHRIQVTLYRMIVRELLRVSPLEIAGASLDPENIECVVARIDESTNESQAILGLESLDLEMEEADVERLVAAAGPLSRIAAADIEELDYQLDSKCDGCVFDVHCFTESARNRRVELIGVEPSTARSLRSVGIATIDHLANLELDDSSIKRLRADPGFSENIDRIRIQAKARRSTLPKGGTDPDEYEVQSAPNAGDGQLPAHEIQGQRLVRVYLTIDYDYVENRLGALAAHVTTSHGNLHTDFVEDDNGRWIPDPNLTERFESGTDEDGRRTYEHGRVRGKDVVRYKTSEWTGRYGEDTGSERELIQGFLHELVEAIAEVASEATAPIHFYVWSRSEMTQLVEACSRASSKLLGHLRELLGCRESLEQLIYSCLQDEVDRRYALGWTGRGLAVASSLRWFGRRYHWRRAIGSKEVDLDRAFTQGIFDFKTDLGLKSDGSWARNSSEQVTRHKFEIHSRYHDSLPAPYWRALWRVLPDPDDLAISRESADAIRRYTEAAKPGYFPLFLKTRVHALRWIEEGIRFKNAEIVKQPVIIADLPDFTLDVDNTAQAAIDFLRLDQHVKTTDWISRCLVPPATRVPLGQTIPVSEVLAHGNGAITATIDVGRHDIDMDTLSARCTLSEGSFVRLTPCSDDPKRGQTLRQLTRGGKTCRIVSIDWELGQVALESMWNESTRYVLLSTGANDAGNVFDFATIDESVSDFVAGRVDERLREGLGTHAYEWFDPENPQIPIQPDLTEERSRLYSTVLEKFVLPNGMGLAADQVAACHEGLATRVQLLLGPPGTGKTTTTAVAALLRILDRQDVGDIVLIGANTHTAVDTLLESIDNLVDGFRKEAEEIGQAVPCIRLAKVHSSQIDKPSSGRIQDFRAKPSITFINQQRSDSVLIVGGTTGAILKLAKELGKRNPYVRRPEKFQVPLLIVDEASMMVFPHFLALATLVEATGTIMLAGDHRQLAPIVAHDWDNEDRPPTVLYQPFASAYEAVQNIAQNLAVSELSVRRSALRFTFRLPPVVRDLIARLYRLDNVELQGSARDGDAPESMVHGWGSVWQGATGLFLVTHSERRSRQSNEIEVSIVQKILEAGDELRESSVAIVTPHRAQRTLMKMRVPSYGAEVDVIDTVERLQGGERPVVIVSATESDPTAIGARAEFILDLNRANVAFSRAKDRLIVVCSASLLDYIPSELEDYDASFLWKSLRATCSQLVGTQTIGDHSVSIFTPPILSAR